MTVTPAQTETPAHGRGGVRLVGRMVAGSAASVIQLPVVLPALLYAPYRPLLAVVGAVGRRLTWIDGRPRERQPEGKRAFALLGVSLLLGILNVCVLAMIVLGLVASVQLVLAAATGGPVPLFSADPGRVGWSTVAVFVAPGVVLLFLAVSGLAGIAWLELQCWDALTRPGAGELAEEVTRLHSTLDDVVAAVDAERRRIERDIHDGVQQRVVALSLLLARAERAGDPADAGALLARAREETQLLLDELRDVAWRTYPAMLARDGLDAALEALRDRTSLPVRLHTDARPVDRAAETAAYFVASEAVTNAVKHSRAARVDVRTRLDQGRLVVTVRDDGIGGADPSGSGLTGIASRVAARGGVLHVHSPAGGPTTIEAVIPCA